jgi:hypothetical protein
MGMATAEANRLIDASLGTTTYVAPTGPMKLALYSVIGSAATTGTEVTGGSYGRQTIAFAAAASASAGNSGAVSFTNMPAITTVAVEIFDSAGSPRREGFGALTANKTTASGDTLTFPIGSVLVSLA